MFLRGNGIRWGSLNNYLSIIVPPGFAFSFIGFVVREHLSSGIIIRKRGV